MAARRTRRLIAALALGLALGLIGTACGGDDAQSGAEADGAGGGADFSRGSDERAPAALPESREFFAADAALQQDTSDRIVKTGTVGLEVDRGDFRSSVDAVVDLVSDAGGLLQSTSIDDTDDRRGTLVLRVPSDRFESLLTQLDDLGDITRQQTNGEDVGEEFVDLTARIRNAAAQERALLRLMDRATTVADTIRVQNELAGVRESIERMKGRLRFLKDQTALSTLTVELREAGAATGKAGTIQRAWDQAVEAFLTVVYGLIVGLGFAVPLALLALLIVVIFRLARSRGVPTEGEA